MGILKWEHTLKSLRQLCAIIAVSYDTALNRTRDLIVGRTSLLS